MIVGALRLELSAISVEILSSRTRLRAKRCLATFVLHASPAETCWGTEGPVADADIEQCRSVHRRFSMPRVPHAQGPCTIPNAFPQASAPARSTT